MRVGLLSCIPLVALLACDSESGRNDPGVAEDSFQDDDIPMGGCDGTACPGAGSGVGDGNAEPVGGACDNAVQCESGVCAATFDDSEAGELVCQPSCIGLMDSTMWCSDDATCCGDSVCSPRGFCVPGEAGADDESGSSGGGDTTGGDTTATTGGVDGGSTGDGSTGDGSTTGGQTTGTTG
ncbi:MAG: hypothetical protein AAF721_09435 [Myxococcota bacterium]